MWSWREHIKGASWLDGDERKLIASFCVDAEQHQIGDKRIKKGIYDLKMLRDITGTPIRKSMADLEALKRACAAVNSSHAYMPASKKDIKLVAGQLFSLLHYKERSLRFAPREVKELVKHRIKAADKRIARAVLSREDIRELCKFGNTQEKAMAWLLFESGMRIGEFAQLGKANITQIDEGLAVKVPAGKTGEREVVVVEATKYVNAWLEEHPKKDADAPLWYSSATLEPFTHVGIALHVQALKKRLNEWRKKQGIPAFAKSTNPHNFRHSRASELGAEPGMTEQILCKYFGWEIGSAMPRTYLHLTSEQVRKAVLRTYGKAKQEEEKAVITDWICRRCGKRNPLGDTHCGGCGTMKDGKQVSKMLLLEERIGDLEKTVKLLVKKLGKEKMGGK
jgi:integrase